MPDAPSPHDLPGDLPRNGIWAIDLSTTVVVALSDRAATRADDHRALTHLVAQLAGVDGASVVLSQVCTHCGAADHGALRVHLAGETDARPTLHVSLARAAGRLALAVTAAGPVGVDLESVTAVARAPLADALLSPAESDALAGLDPRAAEATLAALWTAKEAVLKAAGVGLRVDPRELTIIPDRSAAPSGQRSPDTNDGPRLADWPHAPFPLAEVHLLSVLTSAETVGTIAVVCARRPTLRILSPGSCPCPTGEDAVSDNSAGPAR